jgi:hypothetical protein
VARKSQSNSASNNRWSQRNMAYHQWIQTQSDVSKHLQLVNAERLKVCQQSQRSWISRGNHPRQRIGIGWGHHNNCQNYESR